MLKTGVLLLMSAALACGQQAAPAAGSSAQIATDDSTTHPVVGLQKPSLADMYCAGFISQQAVPHNVFVAGGFNTPHATHFMNGEVIYLSGAHYQVGQELTLIRELRDPNRYEGFPEQQKMLAATGQPYSELGHARVIDTRQKMAIAQIDFLCEPVVPGDFAVPKIEREEVAYHQPLRFDRFAPPNGKTSGRIVLARDFDNVLGNGSKVYLTIGSKQGVKVGDYFRIFRYYSQDLGTEVDALSFKASYAEDTQMHPAQISTGRFGSYRHSGGPTVNINDLPRRSLGELIILNTTASSATGMITFALEDVHIGDGVELEETAPSTAEAASGR